MIRLSVKSGFFSRLVVVWSQMLMHLQPEPLAWVTATETFNSSQSTNINKLLASRALFCVKALSDSVGIRSCNPCYWWGTSEGNVFYCGGGFGRHTRFPEHMHDGKKTKACKPGPHCSRTQRWRTSAPGKDSLQSTEENGNVQQSTFFKAWPCKTSLHQNACALKQQHAVKWS